MSATKPVPRDLERFKYLSPDKPAVMPPDFRLPSAEEMARQTIECNIEMYKRGIDGN